MKVKVLNTQTQVEIREMNLTDSIDRSGECLLGRSPHSGLVLDSPDVSRLHAKFSVEDGQYYFYDLGSSNGSLVNGKIIQPNQGHLLKPGDIIRLGEFVLILQDVSDQPEDLAATVVGDPNATVVGLPPNQDWFSNKEPELALGITDEQAAAIENLEAQEQKEDLDLLAEVNLSVSGDEDIALVVDESVVDEQFAQPEAIEELELSESETLEEPEPIETEEPELAEAEQEGPEPVESLESPWTETSTEMIDEPISSETVEILSLEFIEVDPDLEVDEIQSVEQTQESDRVEAIDQSFDQQTPEAEEPEPDSFSEPTLIQLDESEDEPLALHSEEQVEPESSSIEEPDVSTLESDDLVEFEELGHPVEPVSVSESTFIQPADLTESEEFSPLDSEAEFASEPTFIQSDIQPDIQLDTQSDTQADPQFDQQFNQSDESIETTDSAFEPSSESILTEDDEVSEISSEEIVEPSDEPAYLEDGTVVQYIEVEELLALTAESTEFSEPTVIQSDELEQLTEETAPISESESPEFEEEVPLTEPEMVSEPAFLELDELGQTEEGTEEIIALTSQPAPIDEPILASADETSESDESLISAQVETMPELPEAIENPEAGEIEELETLEETENVVPEPIVQETITEEITFEDTSNTVLPLPEDNEISEDDQPEAFIESVAVAETYSIDENLDAVTGLPTEDAVTGLSVEEIQALNPEEAILDQIASEAVEAALLEESASLEEVASLEEAASLETMEPVSLITAEADETGTEITETEIAETETAEAEATAIPDLASQVPDLTQAPATYPDKYIALLAHDNQRSELIDFVARHKDLLSHCLTVATPIVSDLLRRDLGFEVSQQTPAIPPGGYQTVNSLITSDKILAVIFLRDFFTPQTTQANDEAFSRSCNIHQVMFASNLPTAEAIVRAIRTTVATPQS